MRKSNAYRCSYVSFGIGFRSGSVSLGIGRSRSVRWELGFTKGFRRDFLLNVTCETSVRQLVDKLSNEPFDRFSLLASSQRNRPYRQAQSQCSNAERSGALAQSSALAACQFTMQRSSVGEKGRRPINGRARPRPQPRCQC